MALVVKPNTFSPGATIVAAEHNSNFDTLYDEFNGSISNANISNTAGIAESKLAFDATSGHDHDGTDSKKVDLSAPSAIGGTTPAAGAFTTLAGTVLSASTSLAITGTGDDGVVVTGIKDEDAMGSNSATHLATQQSIKAYVTSAKANAVTNEDAGTAIFDGGGAFTAFCSVAKTITSGNNVLMIFTGYVTDTSTNPNTATLRIKQGSTVEQSISLAVAGSGTTAFALSALVGSLSGSITFVCEGTSTGDANAYGNLQVVELG